MIVLIVAAVVATLLIGTRVLVGSDDLSDISVEEHWLLRHAPRWLAGPARTLDRRFIGGLAVGAAFVVVFSAALVIGWIFSGLDDTRGFARWDVAAAEFGRDNATATSTQVLDAITDLGSTVYLLVVMVLLGVYYSVRKHDQGPLWYLGAIGVGITALNNGLKLIVDRDRPDIAQLAGYAGASFPSGHSAAAAACWAAIALVMVRRQALVRRVAAGFVAVFIAVSVAATRVLLGVHWLTDVIAGVVVGWSWFLLVTVVFGGRTLRLGEPADRLADRAPQGTAGARSGSCEQGPP